jgi:hypothetical protein
MTNKKKYDLLILLVFFTFYVLGLFIYDDYGLSWDEYNERTSGFVSLNYIRDSLSYEIYQNFPKLSNYIYAEYGVVFNLPMAFIEKTFQIEDSKQFFLIRHLFNFTVFFISSIFFYLLLSKRFSKTLSIIGLIFFYLSPRIFAESFYNNKDIIFLSFFIISLFYAISFLNTPSYKNNFLLSVTCSLAIATRVLGIIVPFVVLVFFILRHLDKKNNLKKNIFRIIVFFFLVNTFTLLFWPYLWNDPINNLLSTFESMGAYQWRGGIFYFNEYISGLNIPWHYPIVWILISTPILYLFLFFLGSYLILVRFLKRFINLSKKKIFNDIYRGNKERMDIIVFFILFITLFLVIELNSTLYNGWRQLYFIYPCLIFLSVRGLELISRKFTSRNTIIFISPFLIFTCLWMVTNHPFQFVYFNKFAGNNIMNNFEIDYSGTSNRSALSYIAKNDTRNEINLHIFSISPYHWSLLMIDAEDRKRFKFTKNIEEANFIVTNHFYQNKNPIKASQDLKKKYRLYKEFMVDGIPINSIYIKN